jgi:beta-lactamase regulating signal transducer with metallopeptidase domain
VDHLLNWLWQGCVLAVATALALRLLQRARAKARYALCWASLIAVLLLPLFSFQLPAPGFQLPGPSLQDSGLQLTGSPVRRFSSFPLPPLSLPRAWWTSWTTVMALWTLWIIISCVRAVRDVVWMRQLVSNSQAFPNAVESRLASWNRVRTCGPPTRLVVSGELRTAAVVGCGLPVIAVAPALLDRLTFDELDAVVLHEWAHVQRRDHLLNLGHAAARAVAGWHPAVWWLERQMRIEREAACDEIAVGITGSPKGYAASLATLAGLMPARVHVLPAVGALSSPGLRSRVMRILAHKTLLSAGRSTGAATIVVLVLGGLSPPIAALRLIDRAELGTGSTAAASMAVATARHQQPSLIRFIDSRLAQPPRIAFVGGSPSRSVDGQNIEQQLPSEHVVANSGHPVNAVVPTVPQPLVGAGAAASHVESAPPLEPLVRTTPAPIAITAPASVTAQTRAGGSTPFWEVAADGGVAVGKASQKAAGATAGFFTRFGKSVAASF